MQNSNVRIADIDGWHDDGWCAPLVRARLVAEREISMVAAEIWLPPGGQGDAAVATMTLEGAEPFLFSVPYGQPFKLTGECHLTAGQEVSLRIFCANRVTNPDERRQLSFNLLGITAG